MAVAYVAEFWRICLRADEPDLRHAGQTLKTSRDMLTVHAAINGWKDRAPEWWAASRMGRTLHSSRLRDQQ